MIIVILHGMYIDICICIYIYIYVYIHIYIYILDSRHGHQMLAERCSMNEASKAERLSVEALMTGS